MNATLAPVREPIVRVAARPRLVRLGLLGLGTIGQAVARLATAIDGEDAAGLRFRVETALVRDVRRVRDCPAPPQLTAQPSTFLRGKYDVVVEALGGLEPARTIVTRLLARGIPVVTANKTLIAAAGQELQRLAASRGTTLRYEASALAGVPFLGTLRGRPLVSRVDRCAAVLNGTSNFVLSSLESSGETFASALASAQRLGLAEPDPSRDLDGHDAADKLALLTGLFGWDALPCRSIETQSIRAVTSTDVQVARRLGGAIKPVAVAARTTDVTQAWVGPAFVESRSPLATLSGTLNGIQLSGRYVSDLFFGGPGAGPDVTAATLLDDVVEAVNTTAPTRSREAVVSRLDVVRPAITPWFLRAEFPGIVPAKHCVTEVFTGAGLTVEHVTDPIGQARYLFVAGAGRDQVDAARAEIAWRHRTHTVAYRRLIS